MSNLQIEVGKYYKTRSGEKVLIVEKINAACERTHLGIRHVNEHTKTNGARLLQYYYSNGKIYNSSHTDGLDLIEEWKEPKNSVKYANIYDNDINVDKTFFQITYHDSAEKAEAYASMNKLKRIACVRIEWKEGQFDD